MVDSEPAAARPRTGRLRRIADAVPWSFAAPIAALAALGLTWNAKPSNAVLAVVALLLAAAVLAAVQHAEVVAHRVGEPLGSLILAVSVTVIEVGLIVTLMASSGAQTDTLARDTVFAAVMISCNGIIGLSLLTATLRRGAASFNAEGSATALASVMTLATLCLVLPAFTTSAPGPEFSTTQLVFAGIASLALYVVFVFVQNVRHRDFFVPVDDDVLEEDEHAEPPSDRRALLSLGALVLALVGVVGLAKVEAPGIEDAVETVGAPPSAVGVAIALLVLLPETLAALRNARGGRIQTSFNLGFGSAMASIGLTIPTVAVASIWLDGSLVLGLSSTQIVLLVLTAVVGALTVLPGRATLQESVVHLVVFGAFILLALNP